MEKQGTMNNLKKLVKARGMSLTTLAIELEISQEAISQYISGKIKQKLSIIIKMSKILNTSTDYLLDLTNDPKPSNFTITKNEISLLNKYNKLTNDEKMLVSGYIQGIIDINNIK